MKTKNPGNDPLVESIISKMVAGDCDAEGAVAEVLGGSNASQDGDTVSFKEGEEPKCQKCEYDGPLEEGTVETEEGETFPSLRCPECDTGYVFMGESDENSDSEEELQEAEIDEDNPECPVCGSDNLGSDTVKVEGEDHHIIECGDCGTKMAIAEEIDGKE